MSIWRAGAGSDNIVRELMRSIRGWLTTLSSSLARRDITIVYYTVRHFSHRNSCILHESGAFSLPSPTKRNSIWMVQWISLLLASFLEGVARLQQTFFRLRWCFTDALGAFSSSCVLLLVFTRKWTHVIIRKSFKIICYRFFANGAGVPFYAG